MSYVWDWQIFCQDNLERTVIPSCFGKAPDTTYLDLLIQAWGWTIAVSASAWVLAMLVGVLIGTMRTLPSKILSTIGAAWVEYFRNIPVLLQVFLWYHVFPELIPALKQVPSFLLVICALGFFTSARIAEHIRTGILSLPRGQKMAALAVGMTLPQAYRYVILPNSFRVMWPPLTSEAMGLIKNSSVAFAVSIQELAWYAQQTQEETSHGIEVYLAVTALYILTSLIVYAVFSWIEARIRIPGLVPAAAH